MVNKLNLDSNIEDKILEEKNNLMNSEDLINDLFTPPYVIYFFRLILINFPND